MTLSLFLKASLVSLSVAFVGCAAASAEEGSSSSDAVSKELIEKGTFRLYGEPQANPNPLCDVHTLLTVGGSNAKLVEAVGGACDLFVEPNERSYSLKLSGESCGSKIFTGTAKRDGKSYSIKITDHRTRLCRDVIPALVVVDEAGEKEQEVVRYSFDGDVGGKKTSQWLTVSPRQCGTNPWNELETSEEPSHLSAEGLQVSKFFTTKNIKIDQVGFAAPAQPMATCSACSCARGDTLVVHAETTADADKLVKDYGFAPLEGAYHRAPTQCGTNPWEGKESAGSDETAALARWSEKAGAPLRLVGFVDHVEPVIVCMACQCSRGDLAIVIPQSTFGATKLESLGFTRFE